MSTTGSHPRIKHCPWWGHGMETLSTLLAICEGIGGFPFQKTSYAQFWCFVDISLNKLWKKVKWFEVIWDSLTLIWRHFNCFETRGKRCVCQPAVAHGGRIEIQNEVHSLHQTDFATLWSVLSGNEPVGVDASNPGHQTGLPPFAYCRCWCSGSSNNSYWFPQYFITILLLWRIDSSWEPSIFSEDGNDLSYKRRYGAWPLTTPHKTYVCLMWCCRR